MFKKPAPHSAKLPWDVVLFLALYIALPSYFAIELTAKLPLITASRLVLVLMGIMLILRRRDIFCLRGFCLRKLNLLLTEDRPLRIGLVLYFGILLLVNAVYLLETSEAIKQIFVIVAEEYALVWMLTLLIGSRQKLIDSLKILVLVSGVTAILAAISSVLDYNVFHLLNTAQRNMLLRSFYRWGLLRASAGFSHAVYYGAYCAVMLPLAMYFVETSKTRKDRILFSACIVLDLLGLFLSNSRGSMLAFACVAAVIFFARLIHRSLKRLFAVYLPLIAVSVALFLVVGILSPVGRPYLAHFGDTIVDIFTPDPTEPIIDPTEPGPSDPSDPSEPTNPTTDVTKPSLTPPEFGENENGVNSRLVQLTGIRYTMLNAPIFGLGANAHARGLVGYMYYPGKWSFVETVDMNIVAIICQYGLLGFIGFLSMYGSIGISFLRKKHRGDPLMQYLFLSFLCYMLCLLSISFLDKWFWVFTGLLLSLVNILHKEAAEKGENSADSTPSIPSSEA